MTHFQLMVEDAKIIAIESQSNKISTDALDAARYRALKKYSVFQINTNLIYGLSIPVFDGTLDNLEQVADWLIKNEKDTK